MPRSSPPMQPQAEWTLRLTQAVRRASVDQFRALLHERPPAMWVPDCIWHSPYASMLQQLAVQAARERRADLVALLTDEFHAPLDHNTLNQALMSGDLATFDTTFDRLRAQTPDSPLFPFDLRYAAGSGNVALCERLVELGALAGGKSPAGALGAPAEKGDGAMLRWLLARGADPNEADWLSGTPLILALARQQAEAVRLLLAAGAQPDLPHRDRYPLQIAIEMGNQECLEALLADGANIEQRLAGIQEWSDSEMHPTLLPVRGAGDTSLLRALREGRAELAARLLAAGANPQAVNDDGETFATLAAKLPPDIQARLARHRPPQ